MVTTDTLIPDLLKRHPHTRSVLDRYGLRGCGGRSGPQESLHFFARLHGVEEQHLLSEIEAAIAGDHAHQVEKVQPSIADTIYRRFFTAGIFVILTVGAGWGVWLLWQIGFAGSFTGVSIQNVNAHGHAQIFGWVGLFIMGFAYQAMPRFWQTTLAAPRLAVAVFVAMLIGITLRTAGLMMHGQPWALSVAMSGGAFELIAITTFVSQLVMTFRKSNAPMEPYVCFIFAATGFFLLQAGFSVWHTYTTMNAGTREQLLWYVGTYQAVLRDLQIHGLALLMILGVSMRLLPAIFGLPEISHRRAKTVLGMLLAAIIFETTFFIAYRWTGNHILAAMLLLPWLLLAIGSLLIPWTWKLWRPMPMADRSGKFIRAAYGWLAISMVLLLFLPVYQVASGIPFSHAYYGSIRHAITVGFISMMIMGVAAKVVPTLNGIDPRKLSALWGPFVLVNLGCLLRVSLQTMTDWHPLFFNVVGISGVLELTGLAWWGLHLIGVMRRGKRESHAVEKTPAPKTIEPYHVVADVLDWFPTTAPVFDRFGFTLLRNPLLRRTIARQTTLAQAAAMRHVPLTALLVALRDVAGVQDATACTGSCQSCGHRSNTSERSQPIWGGA